MLRNHRTAQAIRLLALCLKRIQSFPKCFHMKSLFPVLDNHFLLDISILLVGNDCQAKMEILLHRDSDRADLAQNKKWRIASGGIQV